MKNKKTVIAVIIGIILGLGIAFMFCPAKCKIQKALMGCSQEKEKKCCKKEAAATNATAATEEKTPSENCKSCK